MFNRKYIFEWNAPFQEGKLMCSKPLELPRPANDVQFNRLVFVGFCICDMCKFDEIWVLYPEGVGKLKNQQEKE